MATTPAPTPAQIHDLLPMAGARPSLALLELKRRLETGLPAQIDYENAALGLSGDMALQKPAGYVLAPVPVDEKLLCNVIIAHSVRAMNRGLGGAYAFVLDITIFIPDKRINSQSAFVSDSDRAVLIAGLLQPYHSGCADPEGRAVWQSLTPQSDFLTLLPESWRDYSGFALRYDMVQGAASSLWAPD